MTDATSVQNDPFALVKRAYDQTADAMTRSIELVAGNPYLAVTSGQILNGYMALQETFRASVQATLAAMQGSLGGEDSELTARVAALEGTLAGLSSRTEALAKLAESKRAGADASLVDRLVMIESRIEALRAIAERPAPAAATNGLNERLGAIESKLDGLTKKAAPAPAADETPAAPPVTPAVKQATAALEARKPAAPRRTAASRVKKDS